jgi:predicted amidophosphoribosyltransferase
MVHYLKTTPDKVCPLCGSHSAREGELCETCYTEKLDEARRLMKASPVRTVAQNTRRPEPPAAQEAAR